MTSNRSDEPFDGLPDEPSPHEPMADEPEFTPANNNEVERNKRTLMPRVLSEQELPKSIQDLEVERRKLLKEQPFPPMGCRYVALYCSPTKSFAESHPPVYKSFYWISFENIIAGRLVTPPEGDEKGRHMVDIDQSVILRLRKLRRDTLTKPLPPEGYVPPTEFVSCKVYEVLDLKALDVLDEWFGIEIGNPRASPFERHLVRLSECGVLAWVWGKAAPGLPITERWASVEAGPRFKASMERYKAAQMGRGGT